MGRKSELYHQGKIKGRKKKSERMRKARAALSKKSRLKASKNDILPETSMTEKDEDTSYSNKQNSPSLTSVYEKCADVCMENTDLVTKETPPKKIDSCDDSLEDLVLDFDKADPVTSLKNFGPIKWK